MTDEIEEFALEAALRRRRPTALPDGFAARLDRVPDEVRPFPSLAVRSVLAVLPWAAVATVALILAIAPRLFTATKSVGTAPASGWDPAAPGGGFADVGPFGLPWVPLVPLVAVYAAVSAIRRVRSGGPVIPRFPSTFPIRRPWSWRRIVVWVIALALIYAIASTAFEPFTDPLAQGSFASAPGAAETRDAGGVVLFDESASGPEEGTEYIYRVSPGQAFTTLVTVRNNGRAGPVTILGLPRDPGVITASLLPGSVSVQTGLGLLRDPNVISDLPGDLVPFHPVTLRPGEEVVVAVANVAGPCADPAAIVPDRGSDPRDPDEIRFVFETFGWRRVGNVFPPFQITVAADPDCPN